MYSSLPTLGLPMFQRYVNLFTSSTCCYWSGQRMIFSAARRPVDWRWSSCSCASCSSMNCYMMMRRVVILSAQGLSCRKPIAAWTWWQLQYSFLQPLKTTKRMVPFQLYGRAPSVCPASLVRLSRTPRKGSAGLGWQRRFDSPVLTQF